MRLLARNGLVLEVRYLLDPNPDDRVWHARIVGERLTNCGHEFPLFQNQYDEPDLAKGERCQPCALVLYNIKAQPTDIRFDRIEQIDPITDGMPGNDNGIDFQKGS